MRENRKDAWRKIAGKKMENARRKWNPEFVKQGFDEIRETITFGEFTKPRGILVKNQSKLVRGSFVGFRFSDSRTCGI